MTGLSMAIVLAAALLHAAWNYMTKRSLTKIVFIWWFLLAALVIYLPMFFFCFPESGISPRGWMFIAATGTAHALYFWFLGGAYERGDLSLVYPLSRGSGPLFVPILAVGLIGERLSFSGGVGIALVVFGIYVLHLQSFSRRAFFEPFSVFGKSSSLWAMGTGATIAVYSLVDKVGVSQVYPPVYIYLMLAIAWALLSPYVLTRRRLRLKEEWRSNKTSIMVVGFLALATYLMILFAFQVSKVSYVIAVREVSIVFSTLFGIIWLKEQYGRQKFAGSVLIALGVTVIGISR